TLVPERCISYLTQKKKLTDDEEKLLGDFIYGCDDCQSVCPYNKDLEDCKDFKTEPEWVYPILDEIMHMDDKHFKERFIKTAAGWRGKEILKRNARLIKNK
ncbi:MAG: 4Fe-4S double cluster binding domain-containing protein, partial [Eubacterium sp.]